MLPRFVTTTKLKKVTEATMRKRLQELDLSYVAMKLTLPKSKGGLGWSVSKSKKQIEIYKGFLFVIWKYPKKSHSPNPVFDEVWHAHILFTHRYMHDCDFLFGRYLHHTPNIPKVSRAFKAKFM